MYELEQSKSFDLTIHFKHFVAIAVVIFEGSLEILLRLLVLKIF